jgi:ABC-type branched-subunit amino acid transport system substrate-binding protein
MSLAAAHLREAGVDVVLCTGFHQGCGAFIKACRRQGWDVPISNLSSVGSDSLLRLLLKTEREDSAGRLYTKGLVNAQVVPSYDTTSLSGVVAYREAMDQWNPDLPSGAEDSYEISRYSFASLEGYLNARVIGIALQRAGANPTRELFKQALESLDTLDLGIGATISFGPGRHQGLDTVYFNRVQDGRWVPVRDWAQVLV